MSRKDSVFDDPVVREVREAREQLWKEGGGTIEGLRRAVKERLSTYRAKRKRGKAATKRPAKR